MAVKRLLRGFAIGGASGLLCFGATKLATCAAGGPLGMLPGGRLRGEWSGGAEPDLGLLRARREVQIQIAPDAPRSLNVWVVVHEGAIYVPADFLTPLKRWPHQVMRDDRVVLRVGDRLYPRRAVRVRDPALIQALRRAIAGKYDVAPDGPAARADVWFFRLEAAGGGGLKARRAPADA